MDWKSHQDDPTQQWMSHCCRDPVGGQKPDWNEEDCGVKVAKMAVIANRKKNRCVV